MSNVTGFFSSWGLGKFDSSFDGITKDIPSKAVLAVKNILDAIPGVGVISAISFRILFSKATPTSPLGSLSKAIKVGFIIHSLIGGLGGGLITLTADAILSIVRSVSALRAHAH